jgi:hypothetical protein
MTSGPRLFLERWAGAQGGVTRNGAIRVAGAILEEKMNDEQRKQKGVDDRRRGRTIIEH